ncbi:hypothetical protein VI817_000119 [Penicillium citrinum]|nr:hypothetical protein VI817_000119 [Penicillium citrinum]
MNSKLPEAIAYLEQHWLKFKERFIQYSTNQILHLGNLATSRVEGAHVTAKLGFNVPAGTYRHIWTNLKRLTDDQIEKLAIDISYN